MKDNFIKLAMLASVFILVVGCSNSDPTSSEDNGIHTSSVSSEDSGVSSDTGTQDSDENVNVKTIQTYLKNEFTGPGEELRKIIDKDQFKVNAYVEENYKHLFMENDSEGFYNANYALLYLTVACRNGYQLQPANIEIQKVDKDDLYNYKVEVEFSKDGKTNTATVTGFININDEGKISRISNIEDGGLVETMQQ